MAQERLKIKTAVYVIFQRKNKILFLRRFQTGWCDGLWTLPSGHVDPGEHPLKACVHEALEETGLKILPRNLKLIHVMYELDQYIDFYFLVTSWSGKPVLGEPHKSDKVEWLDIESGSNLIIPKVLKALRLTRKGKIYSEIEVTEGNK